MPNTAPKIKLEVTIGFAIVVEGTRVELTEHEFENFKGELENAEAVLAEKQGYF